MSKRNNSPGLAILKGLIILIWLGLMGYWVYHAIHLPPSTYSEDGLLPASEDYLSVYLNHEKIGWARHSLDRLEDGYLMEQRAVFLLNLGGEINEEVRTISTVITGFDFSLRTFNFIMSTGPTMFTARGMVNDGQLSVISRAGVGPPETRTVALVDRLVMPAALTAQMAQKGLKPGGQYTARVFDPLTMSTRPVTVAVVEEARKNVPESDRPVQAYRLRLDYHGLPIFAWVDKNGRTIEEEGQMGLKLVRTTAGEAQAGVQSRPDLIDVIASTSVGVGLDDGLTEEQKAKLETAPRELTYLQVGFSGVSVDGFDLDGWNQRLTGGGRLIVQSPGRAELDDRPEPDYQREDLEAYLRPEPFIQVDDPEIIQLAGFLKAKSPRRLEQVRAVLDWTKQNLDKRPTMSVPSAVDVLKTGYGDCNEHTILATALLRALGIPARPVAGLLSHQGLFFYHAWVEVYLGQGLWLAADPLLGQLPADAGHIRLVIGGLDRQTRLVELMGRLKVTIYDLR